MGREPPLGGHAGAKAIAQAKSTILEEVKHSAFEAANPSRSTQNSYEKGDKKKRTEKAGAMLEEP